MTHAGKSAISYGESHETYSDLNQRVNSLANALLDLGIKKGDRVAIVQHNCHQLIESLFASFKVGCVSVPINAKLHSNELQYVLQNSESSAVIFGQEFVETIVTISREIPSIKTLVSLSNPAKKVLDYEKLIAQYSSGEPRAEASLSDVAWLFYTSGTTGKPKGAMLTQRNLMVMTMNFFGDVYPASSEDIALHIAPLTHGSGLYFIPMLAKGAANIILKAKRFDPRLLCGTVMRRKVTILPFLTPTMIKLLLLSPEPDAYNLTSLRCIVYGGSPMYVEDMKAATKRFGKILIQIYGQGEAPMTISYLKKEQHLPDGNGEQRRRMLSAGIARTDVEVKIFDDEDHELPPSRMGEIVVKGDIVMKGYWKDDAATAETLRNGWLHSGDVGYLDEDGYLYIMDRKKDLIISGGSNIYPREVEEIVLKHPAVQECVVIGVPDDVWGEAVKAIIVLKPGTSSSEQQIIDYSRQHMASYKKPKSVEFVDSIPKNAYGKVSKRELRNKYWIGRERKV